MLLFVLLLIVVIVGAQQEVVLIDANNPCTSSYNITPYSLQVSNVGLSLSYASTNPRTSIWSVPNGLAYTGYMCCDSCGNLLIQYLNSGTLAYINIVERPYTYSCIPQDYDLLFKSTSLIVRGRTNPSVIQVTIELLSGVVTFGTSVDAVVLSPSTPCSSGYSINGNVIMYSPTSVFGSDLQIYMNTKSATLGSAAPRNLLGANVPIQFCITNTGGLISSYTEYTTGLTRVVDVIGPYTTNTDVFSLLFRNDSLMIVNTANTIITYSYNFMTGVEYRAPLFTTPTQPTSVVVLNETLPCKTDYINNNYFISYTQPNPSYSGDLRAGILHTTYISILLGVRNITSISYEFCVTNQGGLISRYFTASNIPQQNNLIGPFNVTPQPFDLVFTQDSIMIISESNNIITYSYNFNTGLSFMLPKMVNPTPTSNASKLMIFMSVYWIFMSMYIQIK
jgi:hypothetical protein